MSRLTAEQWLEVLKGVFTLLGLLGAGGVIANRVNKNYNAKFDAERNEREKLEKARVEEMMLMHEGITAVGHVARVNAEAYLAKCGPNAKLSTALEYHDRFREKEDTQMRRNAATLLHCEGGR